MVVHVAVDGFSRQIIFIHCSDNNKSETVLRLFSCAVQAIGFVPRKIRTDHGVENRRLWEAMPTNHITGSSVHNERVERLNRDINNNIRARFGPIFYMLENLGELDIDQQLDLAVLHVVYLPIINKALQSFKEAHNNHPIRTENNHTPLQLVSRNSHLYNISDEEILKYHIPNLPPPDTYHTNNEVLVGAVRALLQDSTIDIHRNDQNDGCELYIECKNFVKTQLSNH